MATEPKCFEVNLTDRYVLVITIPPDVNEKEADRVGHRIAKGLNDWWKGGKKFMVLTATVDVDIEVRRLGKDNGH